MSKAASTTRKEDRYQYQPWYIKLWRQRYYLMMPWYAWQIWNEPWVDPETGELDKYEPWNTWDQAWLIARGHAEAKMNWTVNLEEVLAHIDDDHDDDDC